MNPMSTSDGQVDHILGSAYQVIKYVAENVEEITALAESVAPLVDAAADLELVADNMSSINSVVTNILPIKNVSDNMPAILNVSTNMADINSVGDNIVGVTAVAHNMPKVVTVADSIASLLSSSVPAFESLRRSYNEVGYNLVIGSFESGGKILTNSDVLLHESTGKVYVWRGTIPVDGKTVPPGSTPATTGGVSPTGWEDVSPSTVYSRIGSELSAETGASKVGLPTGTLTDYLAQKRGIDPRLPPYNYKSTDSLTVRTTSLKAAFDAANVTKFGIHLFGDFSVSSILLEDHTSYRIWGSGSIQGASSGDYVLGIKNCTDLKGGHGIYITGPETGYGCAVKVWGAGESSPGVLRTCSLHTLGFKISNVSPAWVFGDDTHPDNLLSEIVIENGFTYNVREVAHIIGSQAVIEFSGYQAIVTRAAGVPFTVKGGVLHFNGGELQMPGVTDGYMVQLLPLDSPGFENRYGSCYINGTAVECASLWLLAHNPAAVLNVVAGSGKFVMDSCSGFANFNGDNLQADSSYSGSVVITDTCEFHRTSAKPAGTYISGCAAAKVKIADAAFDSNFNVGLQAFRPNGQKPQFGSRRIFVASNLSGQSFPQSVATDMRFSGASSTGENAFYYPSYNATTGVFTVPAGGLKSVKVLLEFNAGAARPNSEVYALVDGAVVAGACGVPNKFVSQMFDVGDLNAGQTLKFRFTNLDTGFSVGTANTDRIVISARTE